jgi:hypothetical protein
MNNRQVMRAVARQMTQGFYQIVIKPRMGWAVQVDADSAKPVMPLRVEPEPDLDNLLTGLKTELDDLVAEQKIQYDQYEARMRGMNAAQKALFIKQQMDGAAYDTAIGDNLDLIKAAPGAIWSAAKAFPGFYKGYLKFLWKIAQLPSKMAGLTAQAVATGDANPLKDEIDKIVRPVATTYEQAMEYRSMLTILCNEPEVYELLYDFADRYYEATHPIELAKMGTSAVTEVLITVLLAIFTAGAGAAANIAAKSGKLVKVFNLLKKITITIKKISPNPKLLDRSKDAAAKAKITSKATTKSDKGMPDVDSPKQAEDLDKIGEKEYGDDKNDGLKTTQKKTTKKNFDDLKAQGHGPQRHEGDVTTKQLEERCTKGIDPMTGTTTDGVTGKTHKYSRNATKVNTPEDYVKAEEHLNRSNEFKDKVKSADTIGKKQVVLEETKLKDIFGDNYSSKVDGRTRIGSAKNPQGSKVTEFSDESRMIGVYRKADDGSWNLLTMYPDP